MFNMKSRAVRGAALFAGAAMALTACSGGGGGDGQGGGSTGKIFDNCDTKPNTCNSVPRDQLKDGGTITFASEKKVKNWNLLSSEGNVLDVAMMLKGTQTYTFYTKPDLSITMNKDLLVSAQQTKNSPQTIVYKIQPDAAWSDGTPITAKDFIYNWKVQNGEDCPKCTPASTGGYERIESVEGSNNGKTVTVTFSEPYTDWKSLWGSGAPIYPAHIAAKHGDLDTPEGLKSAFDWFAENKPTWSAGPYKVGAYDKGQSLALVPNENYWGEKPKVDKVIFRIITKASAEVPALANQEVDIIYPQPQVDLVSQVKQIPGVSSNIGKGLVWEHFDLNLENPFLAKEPLRDAMFTAIDRQAILDKTVGQFTDQIKPLNSHMFVPQQDGYQDVVSATGHGSGNVEKAKQILTDAGYEIRNGQLYTPEGEKVPTFTIKYTSGNAIRKNECELLANMVKPLGINVELATTDDLGGMLTSGKYDITVFAWVGSPYPFSSAVQLWSAGSPSNFGNYTNETVTKLVKQAAAETDRAKAISMLQKADEILAEDAYVLPLYQKPTFIAAYNNIANVRNNSTLDGPVYNIGQWGIRKM